MAANGKTCEYPGCDKPTMSKRARTCSKEHAVALRKLTKQAEIDALGDEGTIECAFPNCHNKFHPKRKSQIYCEGDHYVNCKNCGKKKLVRKDRLKDPPISCSPHCAVVLGHTDESDAKRKENSRKKWGTDSPLQAKEIKEKIKKTREEHPENSYDFGTENFKRRIKELYGVDNVSQLDSIKEKKRATVLDHYGVDNPAKSPDVQEKIKKTNRERYGVDTALQTPETKENRVRSSLEKYGVECPLAAPEVREKAKEANREKYGADYVLQSETGKERIKATNRARYGVDWAAQSVEVRRKILDTLHANYGDNIDNPFQSRVVKDRARATMLEKYGVDNASKSPEIRARANKSLTKAANSEPHSCVSKLNLKFAEKLMSIDPRIHVAYEHVIPGTNSRIDFRFFTDAGREVFVDLNPTVSHNSYLSYWCIMSKCEPNADGTEHVHGTPTDKAYAFDRACLMSKTYPDSDYVQVWSWDDKARMRELISSKLLPYSKTYSARKLDLRRISMDVAGRLLREWHVQGTGRGNDYRYALYDPVSGVPVMVCTFGKSRFNKAFDYEWVRCAVAPGVQVHGGQSRVFKEFLKDLKNEGVEHPRIISYVDYDHSTRAGSFLESCGFREEEPTGPALVWSKGHDRVMESSLLAQGADRLLGTSYGSREECGMDNHDIMLNEGWLPVYTAGNRRFVYGS